MFGNLYKLSLVVSLFISTTVFAQVNVTDSLVRRGDSLRFEYRFEESVESYSLALESLRDSVMTFEDTLLIADINDKMILSQNGENMRLFADSPTVVARHKFSLDDFFLYYPLEDKAWKPAPNQLDTLGGPVAKATYVPSGSDKIYYTAADKDGVRNIYYTELKDSLWTVPSLLNEHLLSMSDEVYPMISADGKKMFFSSKGLYGVGGYDLYVSRWDEQSQDWGEPENLGFPYSSPADDYLYIDTPDGLHSIFASNRGCSKDSVWVYVLEYNDMPVRKAVTDPLALKELALLNPVGYTSGTGPKATEKEENEDNPQVRMYVDKMEEVRAIRDTIASCEEDLQSARIEYASSSDQDQRKKFAEKIIEKEAAIPIFQDSLNRATKQLQRIEMDFLLKGIVIDWEEFLAQADREVVVEASSFAFKKCSLGDSLNLNFMIPEKKFDYSFMVLPEGRFAEDQTIPQGVVYQIQIFSTTSKASLKSFKGLSPMYERKTSSGRYIYRVGLFNEYKTVLGNLNTVKRLGFRSAIIVAYIDGKEVSVATARKKEAEKAEEEHFYEVVITPGAEDLDSSVLAGVRQQADGKDIARVENQDGQPVYIVGLFQDKADAEKIVSFVKVMGINDVTCRKASLKK